MTLQAVGTQRGRGGEAYRYACRARVVVLFTMCAIAVAGDALAEDVDIEEIQVTATRRPANAADVSAALTLIDGEKVRALKLTTDALAARPGVFLQQTTPGQGAPIVRGLKGSEVLHLVDGFRLNNAIFRNAPTQYLALVSPGGVARIEVLRGSPTSLYGSDAVGGVVHVINRLPAFTGRELQWQGDVGVSLDSAERERAFRFAYDIGNERLAATLSADYLDTGNRRIGRGARIAPSGYSSGGLRAALKFAPTDDIDWVLDLQFGRQPKTPRIDELVVGFGASEPAADEFFFAPNERRFVQLRHRRNAGWFGADWAVNVGWQNIVDDRISRNFGALERRRENNDSDLFGLVVTASGDWQRASWVTGAEFYHDDVSSRRVDVDIQTGDRREVRARFPDGSEMQQAAIFTHATLPLGERHALSGGLRLSAVRVDLAATPFSPNVSTEFDDLSADLGWRFDVTEKLSVAANLSRGFRAPNVFDLGTLGERPGNRFNVPNPLLESEQVTQLDLGVRWRSDRVAAEVVAWTLSYDDRITSVVTGGLTADGRDVVQTQNAARAKLWGIEAVGRYAFSARSMLELVLNATRGEQRETGGMTGPADRVPPLHGRLTATFEMSDDLSLETYLVFAARQNRLSARDVGDPRIDPQGTEGWSTANLSVAWRPHERWMLNVAGENLSDERYRVHGSGLDAPGRNLRATLRYQW